MNKISRIDDIAARLREIAETSPNPAVSDQAKRLILRLNSPVRVALLGLPGCGKLKILNALMPGRPLPDSARRITVEVRYGPVEAAEITFSDGSVVHHDGPLEAEDLLDAALIVIERPLAPLRQISLLNLVASADPGEQQQAIAWAARRVDIALWCTRYFRPDDRRIWTAVPERIRDHGYLVLTGSDEERTAEIRTRYIEDFLDVSRVDLSAAPGEIEAGLKQLAGQIGYHAELGRREDTDSALLFLKAQMPRETTKPRPTPRTAQKQPAPADPTTPRAGARSAVSRPLTEPRPGQSAEPPSEALGPGTAAAARPEVPRRLYGSGFGYLRDRGQGLLRALEELDDADVLSHCTETLTRLSDMVMSHEESGAAQELADTVMEAENLVVLLESESGEEAAVEAVSILLQVRREFEAGLAA